MYQILAEGSSTRTRAHRLPNAPAGTNLVATASAGANFYGLLCEIDTTAAEFVDVGYETSGSDPMRFETLDSRNEAYACAFTLTRLSNGGEDVENARHNTINYYADSAQHFLDVIIGPKGFNGTDAYPQRVRRRDRSSVQPYVIYREVEPSIDRKLLHAWSATLGTDLPGATSAADLVGDSDWSFVDDMEIIDDTAEYNGLRSYQSANGHATFTGYTQTTERTVSCWFARDATSGSYNIWSFDPGTDSLSRFRADTGGSSDGPRTVVGDPSTVINNPDGRTNFLYHHFVVTADGLTGEVKLYMDGVLRNTATRSIGNFDVPTAHVHALYNATNRLTGRSDTWRIYDRVLSDADVLELYRAGRDEQFTTPNWVRQWKYVEGVFSSASSFSLDYAAKPGNLIVIVPQASESNRYISAADLEGTAFTELFNYQSTNSARAQAFEVTAVGGETDINWTAAGGSTYEFMVFEIDAEQAERVGFDGADNSDSAPMDMTPSGLTTTEESLTIGSYFGTGSDNWATRPDDWWQVATNGSQDDQLFQLRGMGYRYARASLSNEPTRFTWEETASRDYGVGAVAYQKKDSGGGNPPVNDTPPSISGDTAVGSVLTLTAGAWTGADTVTHQWMRNSSPTDVGATEIAGETGLTYTTQDPADVGQYIGVRETATNADGSTVIYTNWIGPITSDTPALPQNFIFQAF